MIVREDVFMLQDVEIAADLPRANVAHFMLDILDSNQHIRKAVTIHHPK